VQKGTAQSGRISDWPCGRSKGYDTSDARVAPEKSYTKRTQADGLEDFHRLALRRAHTRLVRVRLAVLQLQRLRAIQVH
jgi:hypothetical protein